MEFLLFHEALCWKKSSSRCFSFICLREVKIQANLGYHTFEVVDHLYGVEMAASGIGVLGAPPSSSFRYIYSRVCWLFDKLILFLPQPYELLIKRKIRVKCLCYVRWRVNKLYYVLNTYERLIQMLGAIEFMHEVGKSEQKAKKERWKERRKTPSSTLGSAVLSLVKYKGVTNEPVQRRVIFFRIFAQSWR